MQRVRVSSQQSPGVQLGDSLMTLSPKFKLAAIQTSSLHPSELDLSLAEGPLIPGLPDDVALNCLLRLPINAHPRCRVVCRRWHRLLATKESFFIQRREMGLMDPWLFIFSIQKCTMKIQWQVLDLAHLSWHTIPSMPFLEQVHPRGFSCVCSSRNGTLFVCGGMHSGVGCPISLFLKYEIHKNRWTVMSNMITARSFFACAMIDDLIYAAGGNGKDLSDLSSAEVFDPVDGKWRPIANMDTDMISYDSAVLDGKLFVTEGWDCRIDVLPRGKVYNPKANQWEDMAAGMRKGWTGLSVVVYGHLFVLTEHRRARLKVYNMETDSWYLAIGPPVPVKIHKYFSLSSFDSTIYIVGLDFRVAIGRIDKLNCSSDNGNKWSFSVQWQVLDAPEALDDLLPLKSQVLCA